MQNPETIQVLQGLIQREEWDQLPEQYQALHTQDIAEAFNEIDREHLLPAFQQLPSDRWSAVFGYMAPTRQFSLLDELDNDDGRVILKDMLPDDLTSLLSSLSPDDLEQLMRLLPQDRVKESLKQLGYPEQSAGRLMTTDFVTIRPEWTIDQSLQHVRRQGESEETINTLYTVDSRGHLLGTVGLKRLVLNDPQKKVESLIGGTPIAVNAGDDRTEAWRMIQHYDITALPVLDKTGVLLGVVTVDDVMDVAEEENTEDFHKIGGVGAMNLSLNDARPSLMYRKRIGWLMILVFVNMFAGGIIGAYEDAIEGLFVLMTFLPLVVDTGGNAGSQSATLMVRALATGDAHLKDWFKLLGKELGVALALGLTMGLAVFLVAFGWRAEGAVDVSAVIGLGMVGVVIVGSLVGMLLPFGLAKMNLDPATASAPLITSIADLAGIAMYFGIAAAVLGLTV